MNGSVDIGNGRVKCDVYITGKCIGGKRLSGSFGACKKNNESASGLQNIGDTCTSNVPLGGKCGSSARKGYFQDGRCLSKAVALFCTTFGVLRGCGVGTRSVLQKWI